MDEEQISILFADDITVITPVNINNNSAETIRRVLSLAQNHCTPLNLKINKQKTVHMNFSCNNRNINREADINNEPDVITADETMFLGMTIDKNLTWQSHINTLHKKLSSAIYALRRIRKLTNKETAKIAYHALFESHLFSIWNSSLGSSKRNINKKNTHPPKKSPKNY